MTRIMIVDDNKRARCALKALMSQQAGIDITTQASNGQEAIQNLNEQMPDIVLMDMCMPVMDGLEATRTIKAKWPQIKVIALTMYPDYQAEALAAGADAFLLKGCSMEEITALVQSIQRRETGYSLFIRDCYLISIPPQI